jgi:hypothetical protein
LLERGPEGLSWPASQEDPRQGAGEPHHGDGAPDHGRSGILSRSTSAATDFSAARLASRTRKVGGMPARDERVGQEHESVFKLIVRLAGELGAVDVGERCPQEFGLGTAIRTHPGVAIGCPVRTRVDREAGPRGEPAVLAVACARGRCTTPSGVFSYGRIAQTLQSRV